VKHVGDGKIVTFYSYKGGTGRTMAVANVAWILASSGQRVLAVDWDLESPGLHKFFHPFLDLSTLVATPGVIELVTNYAWAAVRREERASNWHLEYARVMRHAVSLDWQHFPEGATLDFLSAGKQNRDYSSTVSSFEWDNFYDRLGGGQFFEAVREDMKRNYDYTLIDSRTGLSDVADICTVQFPDILVDCFSLSSQSIDGAASVAQQIDKRFHEREIKILPVPMHIDDGEKEKLDAGRTLARSKFAGLPSNMDNEQTAQYWRSVEIPYKPFYAFEEILATFGDEPGSPTSLLASFERLTAAITAGEVTGMLPIDDEIRLRYLSFFTRHQAVGQVRLVLSYAPQDRMWADWIAAVLGRVGYDIILHSIGVEPELEAELGNHIHSGGRVIAVITPTYLASPEADRLLQAADALDPSLTRGQLIPVRVSDIRSIMPFSERRGAANLTGLSQDKAITALLGALGQTARLAASGGENEVRFPGTIPSTCRIPARNPAFTGRDSLLEELRDQLVGRARPVVTPLALYGLSGVGKSQVALEYAHRFMADYDLIWWISAADKDQVGRAMADLAAPLGIRVGETVADTVRAVRDELRRGGRRRLLIFDGADEPDELEQYLPLGPIHILITSLNEAWWHIAKPIRVSVFTRRESVERLVAEVDGLDPLTAGRVARALGDLPLAIEQAAAWLKRTGMSAETYIERLEDQAASILAINKAPSYPVPVAAAWEVSYEQLETRSPAVVRMLKLLAFFSPGPISTELLYSRAMIDCLSPFDKSVRQVFALGPVIQELSRFAMVSVDHGSQSLWIHRLVQAVVRSKMTEGEQAEACEDVHNILVAARPSGEEPEGSSDDPVNWPRYEDIWPHLTASHAIEHGNHDMRDLLIEWVRYQWKRGDLDASLRLAQQLDATWTTQLGDRDSQVLYLRFHLANVLRSQGRYREAYDIDVTVLDRQRDALGLENAASLFTAGGLAADLRALGEFQQALNRDLATYAQLKDLLGVDHRRTLSAANNLAVSYRLIGDCSHARERDEDTLARRTRVLGAEHPYTLWSAANVARDMREAGEFAESAELLRATYDKCRRVLDDDALDTLRIAVSLAVSLRKAGEIAEAMRMSQQTYERYLGRYSGESPDTLSCALNLACDCSAVGDNERARDVALSVREEYEESLGARHPYTLACESNLSVYLRHTGAPERARELAENTLEALREKLEGDHPFTLACAVNLANCLAELGEVAHAEALGRQTFRELRDKLGPAHPDTLVCEANLAITLRLAGKLQDGSELRKRVLADLTRMLGERHPSVVSLNEWERGDSDLETQPI
jgi:hypothetical protein